MSSTITWLTIITNNLHILITFFLFSLIFLNNYLLSYSILSSYQQKYIIHFFYYIIVFCLICYLVKLNITHLMFTSNWDSLNTSFMFSDVLIVLILITALISWYYLGERASLVKTSACFFFFFFLICTLNMVNSTNLFSMFMYFEFIFLPALFFVYQFSYAKKATKTISFLFAWTFIGSVLVLIALGYLYLIKKTTNIQVLLNMYFFFLEKCFLFFSFMCGFGVKIPLWPLHYWLTKVHVEAPTGFSIFLSGFLVKTAFYCMSNLYIIFRFPVGNSIILCVVLWGILDASIRMWATVDIKKLIAFATIQEMNLIFFFLIILHNYQCNILTLFLLIHGILSAFFFFLVDQIQKRTHTRSVINLRGVLVYTPILTVFVWVGILVFRGFPLFVKFIIEWELVYNLISNYFISGAFFFLLISLYGVCGFTKNWLSIIYGQPTINQVMCDILKRDYTLALYLIFFFIITNFFIHI